MNEKDVLHSFCGLFMFAQWTELTESNTKIRGGRFGRRKYARFPQSHGTQRSRMANISGIEREGRQ